MKTLICLVLGLIVPPVSASTPGTSPSPSASPILRTITTVKSSPYCNALVQHFNGAIIPLIANDRALDRVDVQLTGIDDLFHHPDYVSRFIDTRLRLQRYVAELSRSLSQLDSEINALRRGATLTTDAVASTKLRDAADQLERAYVKQRAMTYDLQGLVQGMIDYDIADAPHTPGGTGPSDNIIPKDMRDIKSYLRFDGQRDVIAQAEEQAVDLAYDAASTTCAAGR